MSRPWTSGLGNGSYRNPVLNADWSDPDLVRVGGDHYLTASSFGRSPGLPLLHSRDLVNWTAVGHAPDRLEPAADFAAPRHDRGAPSGRLGTHLGGRGLVPPLPGPGSVRAGRPSPADALGPRGPARHRGRGRTRAPAHSGSAQPTRDPAGPAGTAGSGRASPAYGPRTSSTCGCCPASWCSGCPRRSSPSRWASRWTAANRVPRPGSPWWGKPSARSPSRSPRTAPPGSSTASPRASPHKWTRRGSVRPPRGGPGCASRSRREPPCRFSADTGDGFLPGQVVAATPWRWVGALLGLFAAAPAGTARFTAFRVTGPDPPRTCTRNDPSHPRHQREKSR